MLFTAMFVLEVQSQSPTAVKLESAECKDVILFVILLLLIVLAEPFQLLLLLLLLLLASYADYFSFVISKITKLITIIRKLAASAEAIAVQLSK
jgi:Zn-dependent protease with chaperone function